MRNIIAILIFSGFVLQAQAPASSGGTTRKATTKKSTGPQALTIPANAKANADGTFSAIDASGKHWIYSKTPFGVMRSEVPAGQATADSMQGVKATDNGDTVRFVKASAFGDIQWVKKKTELSDEERQLLSAQTAAKPAKQD